MSEAEMSRDTDAAVFRAMGCTVYATGDGRWVVIDRDSCDVFYPSGDTEAQAWAGVPEVSRSWDACEGVVDWLREQGCYLSLSAEPPHCTAWGATIEWYGVTTWEHDIVECEADTMPLALCRAVLAYVAAKGVGDE